MNGFMVLRGLRLTLVGAAATILVGGLPAQARANVRAEAAVSAKLGVRAEHSLVQAQRLAEGDSKGERRRAARKHRRSRQQLSAAARSTFRAVSEANGSAEVETGVGAATRLMAVLDRDAKRQAELAVEADGGLSVAAAKALRADVALRLRLVVEVEGELPKANPGEQAKLVDKLAKQLTRHVDEVRASVEAAASTGVSRATRVALDAAVAAQVKAEASYALVLERLHAAVEDTVKPAIEQTAGRVAAEAGRIRELIEGSTVGDHTVSISGQGRVTIDSVARVSVETSARVAVSLGSGDGAEAEAEAEAEAGVGIDLGWLL